MKRSDEELRRRNKDSFGKAALYWISLANERLFEISKQLLGIALILLPLTGSVILADVKLTHADLKLLVYGWIALFVSISAGFLNYWIEAKYFKYLSNDSSTREEIWSNTTESIKHMDEKTRKLGRTKANSSFIPTAIQGASLLIGLFIIISVIYNILSVKTNARYNRQYNEKHFHFMRGF